jgi:Ca2+-binding EF-hand superfamily protein
MGQEESRTGFARAFTAPEIDKLRARFDAIADGRDHILKHDFMMMPEVSPHPIVNRVIDVVLEETGQAARRTFEGDEVEVKFLKKEYDIGIDWEAIPGQDIGIQIEEVHGGGVAFNKQQLQIGDDLIAYKYPVKGDGTTQKWTYVSGKKTDWIMKKLAKIAKARDLGKRTAADMHMLFLREEEEEISEAHAKALKDIMKATGAVSDSEEEENIADGKDENGQDIVTEEYEVVFGSGVLGFGFEVIPGKETGCLVTRVVPDTPAAKDKRIRKNHLIMRISKAPPQDGLETRWRDCSDLPYSQLRKYLQKTIRPIAVVFARKIKKSRKATISKSRVEVKRRSRTYMRRSHLNYERLLWEDFVNILGCLSPKTSAEDKKRIAFRMFDTDNDGFIDEDDLYCMLKEIYITHCGAMGCQISDFQLEKLVETCLLEMDDSDDKLVDKDEFNEMMGPAATEILTIAF